MSMIRCACALLVTPYKLRMATNWPTVTASGANLVELRGKWDYSPQQWLLATGHPAVDFQGTSE